MLKFSLFGLGTVVSGGGLLAHSYSDSVFPFFGKKEIFKQPDKVINPNDLVDFYKSQGISEEDLLVYEYLWIDGDKECYQKVRLQNGQEAEEFKLTDCSRWDAKNKEINKKEIVLRVEPKDINQILGKWMEINDGFKNDLSEEQNKNFKAKGNEDDFSFDCNKKPINKRGKSNKVEVHCIEKRTFSLVPDQK
ncbi:hypothetical protein [Mycoplasma suis]|uniref:Uncharacterized protein n=1 Tax=Mycoplasma suis (strain Illinois) TaxID=768700 RepID=F0QQ33_MYCSL|nr:hypothetical protein [Mycoplasma suis]ADX97603.1 hypothetical protein MSU_0059 [Mycoplasma suis str. Illinois]